MNLFKNSVEKKIVMAITGLVMILYLIAHLLGNLTVFKGQSAINTYGSILRSMGILTWLTRVIMISALLIHIYFGVMLTIENRKARAIPYRIKKNLRSTFASRNMIWTGLFIVLYIIYHLLNFSFPLINRELFAARNLDALGQPDIYNMVIRNFQEIGISITYTIAIIAIALHLYHGIQSLFQTVGLNTENTIPVIIKAGRITSLILMLGFLSIPVAIFTGIF